LTKLGLITTNHFFSIDMRLSSDWTN